MRWRETYQSLDLRLLLYYKLNQSFNYIEAKILKTFIKYTFSYLTKIKKSYSFFLVKKYKHNKLLWYKFYKNNFINETDIKLNDLEMLKKKELKISYLISKC